MKKSLLLVALCLLVVINANAKTYKVGTNATYPPFESFDNNGKIIGFDVDLMKEIEKKTGDKFELVDLPFDGLIANVQSGKVNMAISALSIIKEREEKVNFVPYWKDGTNILVRNDNNSVKSEKDFKNGLKMGIEVGSSQAAYIEDFKDVKVSEYDNVNIYTALETGKVDAIIMDSVSAKAYIKAQKKSKIKIVGDLIAPVNVGIAVPKDDPELYAKISKAVAEIIKTPQFKKLQKKWM
ncbi:MAG: basic amino acid ABC transporter substrate-binding protein [Rickettsiales bacterium]|nr:MAG: basic amino acid ABC transporter substrate-binding protein [Rickettsiales bacterium]